MSKNNPIVISTPANNLYREGWERIFGKSNPLINRNMIPPITVPLGKYWKQPKVKDIEIDDENASMNRKTFDQLMEYSTSIPSGVYHGKMWKAEIERKEGNHLTHDHWQLRWYGLHENPHLCTNNSRRIIIRD